MTVRELQERLMKINPDALVVIGGTKDDFLGVHKIGRIICNCPIESDDPYKEAIVVAILSEEEKDV